MFASMKPLRRGAAGLSAAVLGLFAAHAAAADPGLTAAPVETTSAEAQIVVKDRDSGRLRAATPDEALALQQGRAQLRSANAAMPAARSHASGARGARLTDEFMNYTVILKQPDGTLVELCVQGAETTAKVIKSGPQLVKAAPAPTE